MTDGQTHYEGCWETRGHHEFAIAEIKRLKNPVPKEKVMTRDDITIHVLAEEAGLYSDGTPDNWDEEAIERFADLVAAAEREACANLCYEIAGKGDAFDCMDAIRARGKKA